MADDTKSKKERIDDLLTTHLAKQEFEKSMQGENDETIPEEDLPPLPEGVPSWEEVQSRVQKAYEETIADLNEAIAPPNTGKPTEPTSE